MAFNPYFRYESTLLNLRTGMRAPMFPTPLGLSLHSYVTDKYSYTTTSRMYGTTKLTYTIRNIKRDDFDIIKDFWETTLDNGYNDFTIIDNKSRLLFDASWRTWSFTWSKQRGGVYTINIDIDAPVPWTLPVRAAYCMQLNTTTAVPVTLHTLNQQGSYFTYDHINTQDGDIVEYSGDTNCLRKYGGVLILAGDSESSQLTGGTLKVNWGSKINGSLSMFCQFRATPTTFDDKLLLVQIKNDDESSEYALCQWTDGDNQSFCGRINGNIVQRSVGLNHFTTLGTWYDCAITYDAHNGNVYVYICESGTASFTDFLSGSTDQTEQIGTYMSTPTTPSNHGYTEINILKEDNTGGIIDGYNAYLQNIFIFDGHLTPMHFNMMRRLCNMWNNKTTEIYPK